MTHEDVKRRLADLNAEAECLYREGRDVEARRVEERANALARRWFRQVANRQAA